MALIENALSGLGFGEEITPCPFRYTVIGGKAAIIEGVTGITAFSEDAMVFSVKGGCVTVSGEDLAVVRYGGGEALVKGDITGVTIG